jgi:amino acid transporter
MSMTQTVQPAQSGLHRAVLTPLETLAQSIAGIAPSATPGMLIPIVFGFAGNGTWLAYLLATVGMLFTAQCINEFASRSACPGSLYTFVSEGFGKQAGALTGWALLFAYVVCGGACITEFAIYAMSLSTHFLNVQLSSASMMFLSAAVVAYTAYKNVKLSASLMLWLELISVGLILLIVVLTLNANGWQIDLGQLTLQNVSIENVRMGLVMAIFSFVAFESAASLGSEAKDPLKTIPRAIMRSVIFSGTFFAICAYVMVMAFHRAPAGQADLAKCSTPLLQMCEWIKMAQLGHLIDAGIMMSFFAAGLANLNAGARALYKMSQDGLFLPQLGRAHATNCTPHLAVGTTTAISFAIAVTLAACKCPLLDIVGWLGTLATFGFIYAYIATSISAARLLKSQNALSKTKALIIGASVVVLVFALVGSLYPAPPWPYNLLPAIFSVYMLGGLIRIKTKGAEAPSAVTLSATSKPQS